MARLFAAPFYTALDSNGDPISGAKLEWFLTGTSTPHDTFTDNALTVAHANPVIADAAGRFAPIYLQDADYKAVLKDAADVVVKTIDPVHGASAENAAKLNTANAFTGANTYSKTQSWAKGADIASASPLVLGTDGNYFDVTGTTGFSAITVAEGTLFMLQFDGALTLTHGATLDLPGEANITTAAGDRLIGFAEAANTVQVLAYSSAATAAIAATQAEMEAATATNRVVTPENLVDAMTLGTEQPTTSGTTFDFPIRAGAKRVTAFFNQVSLTSTALIGVQLGDAGGIEATGYVGSTSINGVGHAAWSTFAPISRGSAAGDTWITKMVWTLGDDNNTWFTDGVSSKSGGAVDTHQYVGLKSLSGELTTLRVMGGTFDAGSVNVLEE